jgi:5'-nucleotidase
VQPFGNVLVTLSLTGEQIERLLEMQLDVGRLLQLSRGFTYRLVAGHGAPRVERGSARLRGKPLEPKKKYRVTVSSFLAAGGDKFSVFKEASDRREGPLDIEALAAYLGRSTPDRPFDPAAMGGRVGGDVCK